MSTTKKGYKINSGITTIIVIVVMCFFVAGCKSEMSDKIAAVVDRSKLPKLHATDITTVISDSGITRYRISAPIWDVYDQASKPYWNFPKGIHLEKFDLNLKVDANLNSQYARYNQNDQLWELRGKVKAINIQGEVFETEQLFWNQREQRIYSDSLIKITQVSHIIIGTGFDSNQTMTNYHIRKVQGIFPVNENDSTTSNTTTVMPPPVTSQVKKQ